MWHSGFSSYGRFLHTWRGPQPVRRGWQCRASPAFLPTHCSGTLHPLRIVAAAQSSVKNLYKDTSLPLSASPALDVGCQIDESSQIERPVPCGRSMHASGCTPYPVVGNFVQSSSTGLSLQTRRAKGKHLDGQRRRMRVLRCKSRGLYIVLPAGQRLENTVHHLRQSPLKGDTRTVTTSFRLWAAAALGYGGWHFCAQNHESNADKNFS